MSLRLWTCTAVTVMVVDGGCGAKQEVSQQADPNQAPAAAPPQPLAPAAPPPVSAPPPALPRTPATPEDAAAQATEVYADHRVTLFCGCTFSRGHNVARGTCGYETRADDALAKRIDWEHVVPVREFGAHRGCWKTPLCTDEAGVAFSGVRCCREIDPQFAAMETDLFNLVPAIAELTADRSNFPFGEIEGEARLYGLCDFEVDRTAGLAEPRESIRGDIARAYLYMLDVYGDGLPLDMRQVQMFRQWSDADPPDDWERERGAAIAAIQGVADPSLPIMLRPAP